MLCFGFRRRLSERRPSSWRRNAALDGVVFSHAGVELLGLGELREVSVGSLPDLSDRLIPSAVLSAEIAGDPGPRGSAPRIHLVVPFEGDSTITAYLPTFQVTTTEDGSWLTAIGESPAEAEQRALQVESLITDAPRTATAGPDLGDLSEVPSRSSYGRMVRTAVDQIERGRLEKVVLSRSVVLHATHALDVPSILDRMEEREPSCTTFVIPAKTGVFVGASPELLIQRRGRAVSSHPLAGTVSLEDAYGQRLLADSPKDLEEHRLVVIDIASRLEPLVESIDVPSTPSIVALRSVAHLGSSITATLREDDMHDALNLLAAIHPTPAIGGTPRDEALALVTELEQGPRGMFGGAVGWMASDGDGEFVLGIRGAVVNGATAAVRAGAGIVRASTPEGEAEETRLKLASILNAVLPCSSEKLAAVESISER